MASILTAPAPSRTAIPAAVKRYGPIAVALALYAVTTGALLLASYRAADHHFVYALDDPYIAMAMSKSLALHGTWGITRYAFSSSSSSPLFTLLLAIAYRVSGVHEATALVLSLIFGALGLWQADRFLAGYTRGAARLAAVSAVALLAPLFVIGILGMEHTLHFLLAVIFLRLIQNERAAPSHLAAAAALMVGARYEGLFLVGAAVLMLAYRRAWSSAVAALAGSAIPVLLYGAFSVGHGSWFLPNSVALKGNDDPASSLVHRIASCCAQAPHLTMAIVALWVTAAGLRRTESQLSRVAAVVAVAAAGHLLLARAGSAFRYETYLAGLTLVVLGAAVFRRSRFSEPGWYLFVCCTAVATSLFAVRAWAAYRALPGYSRAIYLQQRQMAAFLLRFYPQANVAANDIGAISFFTDIHCTDLVGLADSPIFYAKREGRFTTARLDQEAEANHVEIAMVYDNWFTGAQKGFWLGPKLPAHWIRVGRLTVPHSEALGGNVVSFYAVNRAEADDLRRHLRQFAPTLPASDQLIIEP